MDKDTFTSQLRKIRAAYVRKQDTTNLYYQSNHHDLDIDTVRRYNFWFKDGPRLRFLRIVDIPGTLSGDIIRLEANLPVLTGHTEIEGNIVRSITNPPDPPPELEDDSEDVSSELDMLPTIDVSGNPLSYFLKEPKYRGEITNLLKCQNGSCPGNPSRYVIPLLGRTTDGKLVFPKHLNRSAAFREQHTLERYKQWIRQLVLGVEYLHKLGIVHRDLRVDNLLWTKDLENLMIGDLESKWGQRGAPEIILNNKTEDAGWTKFSDIWDIGECTKCILFGNAPINDAVVWDVPSPFKEIVEACQRPVPAERATPAELLEILDSA